MWGDEGWQVNFQQMDQTIEALISDGEGGVVLLYIADNRRTDDDIWITRISDDGGVGYHEWFPDDADPVGKVVCNAWNNQTEPRIVRQMNRYVVVWKDGRDDGDGDVQNDIFGQVFAHRNGAIRWRPNGAVLCDADEHQSRPVVVMDNRFGDNNIWVAWEDHRWAGSRFQRDIYFNVFDSSPTNAYRPQYLTGEREGIPVCHDSLDQLTPKIVLDDHNGAWIVWEDFRQGLHSDIYGIHIDPDNGYQPFQTPYEVWNTNGDVLCDATHKQFKPQLTLLAQGGHNGVVVAWQDNRPTGKEELVDIYIQRVDDDVLSVRKGNDHQLPLDYAIHRVYPNPFNSRTRFAFTMAKAGQAKINLYDITGRLVSSLADEHLTAGWHEGVIDANNLAAGAYILRLSAGEYDIDREIHLVK